MTKPVTTGVAARELGVGLSTLHRWVRKNLVRPTFRTAGGHLRWDLDDLREQLRSLPRETRESMPDVDTPIHPPIVLAVVTSAKGTVITRRHDGSPLWGFPGGESEPGESPGASAIRETKEETGLEIKVSHVIGERNPHPYTKRHTIYVAARPYQGTEVHVGDPAELAEVRWADYDTAVDKLKGLYEPVREHLARTLKP